jgi:hypothetical protein
MPYVKNPITHPSGKVSEETAKINTNFSILADAFYNSDPENSPIYRACYVGITAPLNPKVGQIWVDTSVAPPLIKVYNGTNWLEVKPANVDEPTTPYIGQFWFDTTVSPPVLKIYDGTNWQVVNSPYEGNTAPTNPYIGQFWLDTSINPPILKIYDGTNWQSNVSNADKLDGQDGSYYLNRANHTGTQPPSSISPQGHGSGLNADLLDGYHAGNSGWGRIPVVGIDGVMEVGKYIDFHLTPDSTAGYEPRLEAIDPNNLAINRKKIWHEGNDGAGSGLDADKVDGFDASQTPSPNVIPVSNDQSVIPQDFLPLFTPLSVPYSQLYIAFSAPASPQVYDSFYNTNTNELFYWNGSAWIKVDWTKWVQNDIWYRLGKLRISNGQLQVSNDGTNWYQVFPALGRTVEVIADDTNTADNFKIAYLTVGQALLLRNKYKIRCACINPSAWSGELKHSSTNDFVYGFRPNGINISDGAIQILRAAGNSTGCAGYTGYSFVPIVEGTINDSYNWAAFNFIVLDKVYQSATGRAIDSWPSGGVFVANGSFPSNGYFIGTMTNRNGINLNVDYLIITRQG